MVASQFIIFMWPSWAYPMNSDLHHGKAPCRVSGVGPIFAAIAFLLTSAPGAFGQEGVDFIERKNRPVLLREIY